MSPLLSMRFYSIVLVAISLGLSHASAGVITQSVRLSETLENAGSITLNKFDVNLGYLQEVQLTFDLNSVARITAVGPGVTRPTVEFFDVRATISFGDFLDADLSGRGMAQFNPQGGRSGVVFPIGTGFAFLDGQGSATVSDPTLLAQFTGSGAPNDSLLVPVIASQLQTDAMTILSGSGRLTGQLTVTYVYDTLPPDPNEASTPEPASLAILGIGAIVMVGSRNRIRSRREQFTQA